MYKIGFLNSKGGVGKSTLCAAIAVRASQNSKRVCIVDLDPQESVADWWKRRGAPANPTLFEGEDRASDAVEALEQTGWDWVFFDGPPGSLRITEDAVKVCDLIVIPMRPSSLDLVASQDAVAICQESGKPYLIVLNQVRGGSAKDKLMEAARGILVSSAIPIAETTITLRSAFVSAMTKGNTGAEKDHAARDEVDALWREIKAATLKAAKARSKKGSA